MWTPREEKIRKLEVFWIACLRSMVKGGWKRKNVDEGEYSFQYQINKYKTYFKQFPSRVHTCTIFKIHRTCM